MPLDPGTRLGPYEITGPIGAGGMGEVYKARVVASLSRPHICALHDVGTESSRAYLVMEYLEGETLADRLARGPLPLADVIRFGSDIATALHAAHRQHIVHRDPPDVYLRTVN